MNREKFLRNEFIILTITAGLATRNKNYPVYNQQIKNREEIKKYIYNTLLCIGKNIKYQEAKMSSDEHTQLIEDTAKDISKKFSNYLHEERLRIGIMQKLINLYLKYLWCAGFIKQPPHCPINGIIRDKAGLTYNWILSDCINDYKNAIQELQTKTSGKSLSEWELETFNDR